jgi:hypothetical protein
MICQTDAGSTDDKRFSDVSVSEHTHTHTHTRVLLCVGILVAPCAPGPDVSLRPPFCLPILCTAQDGAVGNGEMRFLAVFLLSVETRWEQTEADFP